MRVRFTFGRAFTFADFTFALRFAFDYVLICCCRYVWLRLRLRLTFARSRCSLFGCAFLYATFCYALFPVCRSLFCRSLLRSLRLRCRYVPTLGLFCFAFPPLLHPFAGLYVVCSTLPYRSHCLSPVTHVRYVCLRLRLRCVAVYVIPVYVGPLSFTLRLLRLRFVDSLVLRWIFTFSLVVDLLFSRSRCWRSRFRLLRLRSLFVWFTLIVLLRVGC